MTNSTPKKVLHNNNTHNDKITAYKQISRYLLRFGCIVIYCGVAAATVGFDFSLLFNLRESLLVLAGTILLTTVSRPKKDTWRHVTSWNAVVSGILATVILLSVSSSTKTSDVAPVVSVSLNPLSAVADLLPFILQKLRPLLYGFIISFALHDGTNHSAENVDEQTANNTEKAVTNVEQTVNNTEQTVSTCQSTTATTDKQPIQLSTGDAFRDAGLSKREAQIARMAASGLTNGEIAESLCISPVTVKTHMSNIFEKTGFSARAELRNLIQTKKEV